MKTTQTERTTSLLAGWMAIACLGIGSLFSCHGQAQTPANPPGTASSEASQQEIRASATQIQQQIEQINSELRQNGVGGEEISAIDAALQKLGHITGADMENVIAALHGAGAASDSSARRDGLVTAYQGQQGIISEISALTSELQLKQTQDQLRLSIRETLRRQLANLRLTSDLAGEGKALDALGPDDKSRHEIAASNQAGIASDVPTLLATLDKLIAQTSDKDAGAALKAMVQDASGGGLQPLAADAAQTTLAAAWAQAVQDQKKLADLFLDLADRLSPPQDVPAALQSAKSDLAKMVEQQQNLAQTPQANTTENQAAVQDQAALAARNLQSVNAQAAQQLQQAQQAMEQSRQALAQNQNNLQSQADAAKNQQQALAALQQAQKTVDQQIEAEAQAQAATPQQRLDQLNQVAAALQQAQAEQQRMAQNSSPEQAAQLAQQLAALQQQALPVSPEAGQALGQAAVNAAQQKDNSPAAQAAAAQVQQQLAQAQQAVQRQLAQAAPTAAAARQLAQAQQALQAVAQQVSQAQASMQNAASLPQAVNQLLAAQQALQAAQSAAPQSTAGGPQPLQAAAKAMQEAMLQAAQGKQQEAQNGAQKAQQALASAQSALSEAQKELDPQANQNPGGSPAANQAGGNGNAPIADSGWNAPVSANVSGNLTPHDRAAIVQIQAEKAPAEYQPMISQYYKNLAEGISP